MLSKLGKSFEMEWLTAASLLHRVKVKRHAITLKLLQCPALMVNLSLYTIPLMIHVWRMVTENCVWRKILKYCAWRVISKHCVWRQPDARQTPTKRQPDATFWNQASGGRFCVWCPPDPSQAQGFEIRRQTQDFKIMRQTLHSVTMRQTCSTSPAM